MFKKIACFILITCFLCPSAAFAADNTYKMTTSEAGIAFIKHYEGFRSTVYTDSGGYAIGYGTHCDPADYPMAITEEEGEALLRSTLSAMEEKLNNMAGKLGIALAQNQFDALISLTYNLGTAWMNSGYRLYNMLANGIELYTDDEIINTFGRYCHIGSTVNSALAWRRLAEAKIFLYSDYKTGGTQNYEYSIINDAEADSDILFEKDGGMTICKYSDISYANWYYKYLSPLTYTGVFNGYEDGTFRAEKSVSCGEALKLIIIAAGYGEQSATDRHWASGYLTFALNNSLIPGGAITDLDTPVSRLLVAEIAANALGLAYVSGTSPFSDTDDSYVLSLYNAGILTGSYNEAGALVYLPDDALKRSEICAVIWRIENYL